MRLWDKMTTGATRLLLLSLVVVVVFNTSREGSTLLQAALYCPLWFTSLSFTCDERYEGLLRGA